MDDDWLHVRRARLSDVPFIRRLTCESIVYTIPLGRDVAAETVAEGVSAGMKRLEVMLYQRKAAAVLVAIDRQKDERLAGFVILQFGGTREEDGAPVSHIMDLAIEQEYMGRFVVHRLVREAARITARQGVRYMTATVTASNERSLLTGIKMGFEIDRYHLVLATSEEGIAPMPGRPPEQHGHDVDRARRRARRLSPPS